MTSITFPISVLVILLAYALGFLFTETEAFYIARWRITRFKAFECRPCLTFHLTWLLMTELALIVNSWAVFAFGIAAAFAQFIGLKIDQREKTVRI